MLDLYHRTTADYAARIVATFRMVSRENTGEAYFSTARHGQAEGYGTAVVHVRVPENYAELDDEFPDGAVQLAAQAASLDEGKHREFRKTLDRAWIKLAGAGI